jgi:inner membrane protein
MHLIASPLNSFLWRILVIDGDTYYEGFRSIFDKNEHIEFTPHPRQLSLLDSLSNTHSIDQLDWFTNGFYTLKQHDETLIATDLRMGLEPNYVFTFNIAQLDNEQHFRATPPELIRKPRDAVPTLKWVWQRIWNEDAQR